MTRVSIIDAHGLKSQELKNACEEVMADAAPLIKVVNLNLEKITRPTPADWRNDCSTPNDQVFMEVCSNFGSVYGYADLQEGRLVQEIFPILKDASKQVGSGAVKLELHTEDPALEYRADYLGFLCISNVDKVPTVVSVPDFSKLSKEAIDRLTKPVFRIESDRPSHGKPDSLVTPVLFRDELGHFKFIYDPVYIVRQEMADKDQAAFGELVKLVEDGVTDFLLEPGEIGFVDNYQVAHGRPQYTPRYDGTDRWLKRAQISRHLDAFTGHAIIPGKLMP